MRPTLRFFGICRYGRGCPACPITVLQWCPGFCVWCWRRNDRQSRALPGIRSPAAPRQPHGHRRSPAVNVNVKALHVHPSPRNWSGAAMTEWCRGWSTRRSASGPGSGSCQPSPQKQGARLQVACTRHATLPLHAHWTAMYERPDLHHTHQYMALSFGRD